MTQIAAEELDVRPDQVRIVSGETDVSPAEYFTSGSYSISVGGASIRLVCAEVRSMFLDRARRGAGLHGQRAFGRGRQIPARGQGHRPRLLVDGARDRARPPRDRHRAGQKAVQLQDRRQEPAAARPAGQGRGRGLHPRHRGGGRGARRVLRQPWRGAHLAALDEAAVRKAAKAPIEILREGEFVAFTADSELAVMRAAEAARELAQWEGGTPAPADVGSPAWLKAQPRDEPHRRHRQAAAPAPATAWSRRYSRPFLTYGSIGPSCALAEFKDGALKVWSHTQGPSILRDWLARALGLEPSRSPCSTARAPAPTATTPPTIARSTPPSSR